MIMKKIFRRLFTRTYTLRYLANGDIYVAKYKTYEAAVNHALSLFYDNQVDPTDAATNIAINGKPVDFVKWDEQPFKSYKRNPK